MNRRRFLGIAGAGVSSQICFPGMSRALRDLGVTGTEEATTNSARTYGSGHFGEWITDEFGLPAYRYTCDQLTDAHAQTPVHAEWIGHTDHLHQVGNDRVVAVASNFGYVQVRQDEGGPKFLNDHAPELNRYGGGIGYLTDGESVVATYYGGRNDSFERIFGEGYFRKVVKSGRYEVDQTILAPYGDDPVVISLVKIINHGTESATLRWVEYWNCQNYQFSMRAGMEAGKTPPLGAQLRRDFSTRFEHHFEAVENGKGLIERQHFRGRSTDEEQAWARVKAENHVPDLATGTSMDDLDPPTTFLISLDAPMSAYSTSGVQFFGSGGVLNPSGLKQTLGNGVDCTGPDSAHIIERSFTLQPGQAHTISFLYGYLPAGYELKTLVAKYSVDPAAILARSNSLWKSGGIHFSTPQEPWVEREIWWHNYYLRSALTWDSFFREPILSQGCVYQYVFGFQGAARDPLQHTLPFIFSDPAITRGILRYTLKEIQPDGSIPYGIVGNGVPMPSPFLPSDQELWLLWVLAEYVLATRDKAFMEEKIPLYPRQESKEGDPTVAALAMRCFRHLVDVIGVGEHGLMKLLKGDWNDGIVVSQVPPNLMEEVSQKAESTLNSAMACYVMEHYARLLTYMGETPAAAESRAKSEAQRKALRAQWAGRWFRRAWLGPHLGWLGDDQIWLEPQPWAIIGGAATAEQSAALVNSMNELVRGPSPIGAIIQSKGTPAMNSPVGTMENGGVWPSINGTLIWALALEDGAMAWDEWKKNSLGRHAEVYPNIWYGIWSGPDNFNGSASRYPGQTRFADSASTNPKERADWGINWTDFPVMNLHQHAWPLYTVAKQLGLEFREGGLSFKPALPLGEYEFRSPLLGFIRSPHGYKGWYAPSTAGTWEIEINLPDEERRRFREVRIESSVRSLQIDIPAIRFQGESRPASPLQWELRSE
jgi:hypothetical protein